MKFEEGLLGDLTRVSYYLKNIDPNVAGTLVFQGSMDRIVWTDLFTTYGTIHEDWNMYQFDS
jgi:hypothetical protein